MKEWEIPVFLQKWTAPPLHGRNYLAPYKELQDEEVVARYPNIPLRGWWHQYTYRSFKLAFLPIFSFMFILSNTNPYMGNGIQIENLACHMGHSEPGANQMPGRLAPRGKAQCGSWGQEAWEAFRFWRTREEGKREWMLITIWGRFSRWKRVDWIVLWCSSLLAIELPLATSKQLKLEIGGRGWSAQHWAADKVGDASTVNEKHCPREAREGCSVPQGQGTEK